MAESSSAAHESEFEQMRRKASGNWTLEGDAYLLGFMKNISNNLEARCAKTTKNLNQMTIGVDRISVDLGNTTNKLLFISNSKFVEHRVQDEDETLAVKTKPVVDEKPRPMESIEAIKIAAHNSLKMMDKCYVKVSFNLESGDESDDEDRNNNTVLRPKDPFAQQMPFLIGTREWKEKWHVGLVDSDVESDEEVDEGQYSESSQEEESIRSLSSTSLPSNAPTYSESEGSIWGLQQQLQQQQPSKLFQPDDDDVVSNKSITGFRSSNTDFMNDRGGIPVLPTANTRPPLAQEPPLQFAPGPAKKPTGGGLFDDDDDDFDVVDRNANQKPKPATNLAPSTIFPQQRLPEPRKIVNLFDDLPPDDDEADWAKPAPVNNRPESNDLFADTKQEVKKKVNKIVTEKKTGGLFDDDYDFIPRPVEKPKTRITNLFDDEPEDDDFFDAILSKNVATKPKPEPKRSEPVQPSEAKKQIEPTKVSAPKTESPKPVKKKLVNLFDDSPPSDDDFDDLFKPNKGRHKPAKLDADDSIGATMSVNTQDVDKLSIGDSDREAPKPKPRTVLETKEAIKEAQVPKEVVKKVEVANKVEAKEPPIVVAKVVEPVEKENKATPEAFEQTGYIEDLPPEDDDFEVTAKAKLSPFMQQLLNKEPVLDDIFAPPPPLQKTDKSTYQSMPLFDDVPPDDEFGFGVSHRDSDDDFFDEKVPALPVKQPSSYLIIDEPPADDFEVPAPAPPVVEEQPEDPPSVLKKIQQFSDAPEPAEPKDEKPNRPVPKKLNTADFKINMAALLPGARLPSKHSPPEPSAAESIENDIEYTLRKNERPVSEPPLAPVPEVSAVHAVVTPNPGVLPSLSRNRAKMPMNRQPSTRRARQLSYQQSLANRTVDESTDDEAEAFEPVKPVAMAPKKPIFLAERENDLFAEISKHPAVVSAGVKSSEKSAPKQKGLASTSKTIHKRQDEQPIIKIAQKSTTSSVRTTIAAAEKPKSRVVLPQPPGTLFEDDLFSSPFQPVRTVAPKVIPAKAKVAAPLFSSPDDDDLFGPPKGKKVPDTSKGAVPKMKTDLFDAPDDDDDFFSIPVKKVAAKPEPQKPPTLSATLRREEKKSVNSFGEDDFFNNPVKITAKPAQQPDPVPQKPPPQVTQRSDEKKSVSLFGDDDDDSDDLFGGGAKKVVEARKAAVQPKKTEAKVVAKPKASSSKLFEDDDDDDDLFGSSTKTNAPSVVRTAAPLPERKTSLKTTTAPALDDPLADLLK